MSHKSLRTLNRELGKKQMIHNLGSNCYGSNKFVVKLKPQTRELLGHYETDTPDGMEEFRTDLRIYSALKAADDRARHDARLGAKPQKEKKGKKVRKPKK